MHSMNVKTKYYNLLKSGSKTIELRLFDEKRKKSRLEITSFLPMPQILTILLLQL